MNKRNDKMVAVFAFINYSSHQCRPDEAVIAIRLYAGFGVPRPVSKTFSILY